MPKRGNESVFIALHPEDKQLLDDLVIRQKRTRSELVTEALRAHFEVMAKAYARRMRDEVLRARLARGPGDGP